MLQCVHMYTAFSHKGQCSKYSQSRDYLRLETYDFDRLDRPACLMTHWQSDYALGQDDMHDIRLCLLIFDRDYCTY